MNCLRKLHIAFILLIGGSHFTPWAQAGPGAQDLTFGNSGTAATPFPPAFRSLQSIAVQSDGLIVGAGPADSLSGSVGVVRWLASGAVDAAFGPGGIVTLAVAPVEKVRIAVDGDGRILVMANRAVNSTSFAIHLWRLLATGALDPAFGSGGQFILATAAGRSGLGYGLAVQADGRPLIGGGSADGFFLTRLTAGGALDVSFGAGGTVNSDTPNVSYRISALTVQPDGAIVGCGWQKDGATARNPFVLRLTPAGLVDPLFGNNGLTFLFALGELNALTLRGDGAIVTGGTYQGSALLAVVRPNGARDPRFVEANNGRIFNTGGTGAVQSVAVQSNGRIVVSGSDTSGTNVRAFSLGVRSDGTTDAAFGTDSFNFHDFRQEFNAASQSTVETVITLADRRLLVGGVLYGFGYAGAVLHRLAADPAPNPNEAWRITHFGTPINRGPGADAADPDGDGVPNLAEFAFSQDPRDSRSHTIPVPVLQGGQLRLSFPDPDAAGLKNIACRAEATALLTPGSWQFLPDTGDATTYNFSVPLATNPRAFIRLLVDQLP